MRGTGPVDDSLNAGRIGGSVVGPKRIAVFVGGILIFVFFGLSPLWLTVLSLVGIDIGGTFIGSLLWYLPVLLPVFIIGFIWLVFLSTVGSHSDVDNRLQVDNHSQAESHTEDDNYSQADNHSQDAEPLDILEARYTTGEIDFEEYEQRLDHLFELDADHDTHPQLKQLAIRYARGEIDRETVDDRIEGVQSNDPALEPADVDRVIRMTLSEGGLNIDPQLNLNQPSDRPIAIQRLRRRYADGELSHEEYEKRLSTLRETASKDD